MVEVRKTVVVKARVVILRGVAGRSRRRPVAVLGMTETKLTVGMPLMITFIGITPSLSCIMRTIAAPNPATKVHIAPTHPYSLKHLLEPKTIKLETSSCKR